MENGFASRLSAPWVGNRWLSGCARRKAAPGRNERDIGRVLSRIVPAWGTGCRYPEWKGRHRVSFDGIPGNGCVSVGV
jgi:hypothetical protein